MSLDKPLIHSCSHAPLPVDGEVECNAQKCGPLLLLQRTFEALKEIQWHDAFSFQREELRSYIWK